MRTINSTGSAGGSLAERLVSSHQDLVGSTKAHTEGGSPTRSSGGKSQVPVSTDFSVDEWLLVDESRYEPCGLLFGVAIFHIGLVGVLTGNGEVDTLSNALTGARELATKKLQNEARRVGATGVIGVRLTIDQLGGKSHLARFMATGTGVRPKGTAISTQEGSEAPFLTALSGQEFALLLRVGLLPVGLVMGVCVYHVRRLGSLRWLKTYRQSKEMRSYTEALYRARELAMGRLQTEAVALDAEGVIGVSTSELSHIWGSHVIEFYAMGTAVRSTAEQAEKISPEFVLSVHDAVVLDAGAMLGNDRRRRAD